MAPVEETKKPIPFLPWILAVGAGLSVYFLNHYSVREEIRDFRIFAEKADTRLASMDSTLREIATSHKTHEILIRDMNVQRARDTGHDALQDQRISQLEKTVQKLMIEIESSKD